MSQKTKIQWCDSTVNPTMGCPGCELFLPPARIVEEINTAVSVQLSSHKTSARPDGRSKDPRRIAKALPRPNEHSNP